MSYQETTMYPTDILKSKYRTILEASSLCGCTIQDVLNAVNSGAIPYAEFSVPGQKRRIPHVNPEDLERYLKNVKSDTSN